MLFSFLQHFDDNLSIAPCRNSSIHLSREIMVTCSFFKHCPFASSICSGLTDRSLHGTLFGWRDKWNWDVEWRSDFTLSASFLVFLSTTDGFAFTRPFIYIRWIWMDLLCIFLLVFSIVITSLLFHFSIRFFHYYFWLLLLFYKHYLSKTITERAQWIALPVLLGLLQQWSSSEKGPETVFWVLLIICTCTSFCAYLRESVSVSVWAPTLAHVFPYEYFKRKYLCVIMT